jgi:hypothetical protein
MKPTLFATLLLALICAPSFAQERVEVEYKIGLNLEKSSKKTNPALPEPLSSASTVVPEMSPELEAQRKASVDKFIAETNQKIQASIEKDNPSGLVENGSPVRLRHRYWPYYPYYQIYAPTPPVYARPLFLWTHSYRFYYPYRVLPFRY